MSDTLIRMPRLADTLVEGTVGQWLKQIGEAVGQGEALASIETDKVTTEITSPAAGTLLEVLVAEGQTVPVETVIARIGAATPSPATPSPAPASPAPASTATPSSAKIPSVETSAANISPAVTASPQPPPPTAAPKPTPVAARLLAEHNLTPHQVPSRAGRLTKQDVVHYLQHPPALTDPSQPSPAVPPTDWPRPPSPPGQDALPTDPQQSGHSAPGRSPRFDASPVGVQEFLAESRQGGAGAGGRVVALSSMRRAIAEHMARASRTIPHGQTVMDPDLTRLVAWRDLNKPAFLQAEKANLTFTVLFVYALARQLATMSGGSVDLGVAVALDAGLIVPVVRRADALSLGATARTISDLAARARARKLALEETQGAQMTVTNVGSFGTLTASPIVPMGQRGILGPGLVERRPLPGPDHGIRLGWRCLVCLMFDRREFDEFSADRLLRGVVDELDRISTGAAVSV